MQGSSTTPCLWLALVALVACGGSPGPAPSGPAAEDDEPVTSRHRTAPSLDDDEDDGDGMAVQGLRGRLEPHDIQRGIQPHARALSDCYTRRLGKSRFLGGRIELKFVVDVDGTVQSVQMNESDLGAWPMEACMLEVSQGMRFARPRGNAAAEFTVPLSFDATQATGHWDDARTQDEVSERVAELAGCAEEAEGAPSGSVWITLYVGTRGKVVSAGFASPDAPLSPAWASCAAGKLATWTLTDPRGRVTKARFLYGANQR